jgi:hypothetical protein
MKYLFLGVIMALTSVATAGNFVITDEDGTSVSVHYTGYVEGSDVRQWNVIADYIGNRVCILTIDSGGGSAYGGLDLYWALEAHPRLVTKAGSIQGAWSAAAIMWLAGDHKLLAPNSGVWFHAAFCTWDPNPMPSIGCDTSNFQRELIPVLANAGFHGPTFNLYLNHIQVLYGTDGWVGVSADGWFIRDTTDWTFEPFNPELLK